MLFYLNQVAINNFIEPSSSISPMSGNQELSESDCYIIDCSSVATSSTTSRSSPISDNQQLSEPDCYIIDCSSASSFSTASRPDPLFETQVRSSTNNAKRKLNRIDAVNPEVSALPNESDFPTSISKSAILPLGIHISKFIHSFINYSTVLILFAFFSLIRNIL